MRQERQKKAEEKSKFIDDFMSDFGMGDALTVVIPTKTTQDFQIKVTKEPALLKLAAISSGQDPKPFSVQLLKESNDGNGVLTVVKEFEEKVEIMEKIEIFEESDLGTYHIFFNNRNSEDQDVFFIVKQIALVNNDVSRPESAEESGTALAGVPKDPLIDESEISEEERQMFSTLNDSYR